MIKPLDISRPFDHTLRSRLGELIDRLEGPCRVYETDGPIKSRVLTLSSTEEGDYPKALVHCYRTTYVLAYRRWFVKNRKRTTYRVSIEVDLNLIERYGQSVFADKTYPLLCSRFLEWTTYPHVCAIDAFTDQLYEAIRRAQTEKKA